MTPKTITTYLINGNPNGLKSVFLSNKICKALVIPRTEIDKVKTREEAFKPSIYFLIDSEENKIYIGESENFYERIKNHVSSKEFWNLAIQFFSQNNDLTKADVKYLEYISLKTIKEIGNVDLEENKQKSTCPNLPEHQKASVDEFFQDVKLITGFLGYDFFNVIERTDNQNLFYCKRNGIEAIGIYDESKFVVLKGSKITKELNPAYEKYLGLRRRNELLGNNFKSSDSNELIFTEKDIIFNSPSSASCFCLGMSSNGWIDWKNKEGKTLDEVVRKKIH